MQQLGFAAAKAGPQRLPAAHATTTSISRVRGMGGLDEAASTQPAPSQHPEPEHDNASLAH